MGEPCRGAVAVCVGAYLALLSAWRSPRPLGAGAAHAAEYGTGPWVKGYTDIFGGILPPQPGLYVRNDAYHYEGDVGARYLTGMFSSKSKRDISPTSWR